MARRRKKRALLSRLLARPKPKPRGRADGPRAPRHQRRELVGLGLLALAVFLAGLLYLGWSGGSLGGAIADVFRAVIGAASFAAPVVLAGVGGLLIARSSLVDVRPFRTGLAVVCFGLLLTLGREHGGAIGRALEGLLGRLVGETGAMIVGVTTLLAGVLLLTGASIGALVQRSGTAVRRSGTAVRRAGSAARRRLERPGTAHVELPAAPAPRTAAPPLVDGVRAFPDVVGEAEQRAEPEPLVAEEEETEPQSVFDPESTARGEDYRLPDRAILHRSPQRNGDSSAAAARVAEQLVQTLTNFGVEARVTGQISGPRVTRYELQLAPGTKVSKVAALKDDLSYALATTEIRILAPIPGKQAVGVELPNLSPNLVTLGDIFEDLPPAASPLAVWLGKDISGAPVWTDLARMPHILIAGTTGSGKSGCINTMLTSILLRATPDDVRLILVDPKRIELGYYESIPHLLTPVVSSPKEASAVLANVVGEMDRRYERLSLLRARNLPEANRALRGRGERPLPYLLVVIDELADLMMISPQEVEDAVIRLAQKSRAVGIHLVLATQRPSVDVITGMIKANVPSRIAFAVSSQTDSRVILDQAGAESLLGQGDMLFRPLGTSRLQRLQGAYVSEEEIALVVEQCKGQREPELDESLLEAPEPEELDAGPDEDFDPDEDPLLDRAIEIVVQTQTASVSLLQRRLRVGYTRAGRLIDMLERRGVISGYEGSKPRRVLVSEAELDRVLSG
ncbi:MAG: DNA translocase FtsK [Actinomycetota bacterium]|nr:DNA translocase FtsK [Actinomycetota bacterium]